jgi:simple sugar transport system ATP-binding protein
MAFARSIIDAFDVRGGTPASGTRLLSGGNMQKLILGRNLSHRPRILIAAQPARGLDEGAVAAVHTRILEARKAGTAVLLISEDLDEVISLADRIQAIVGGRLSPPLDAGRVDARRLGLMMSGDWSHVAEAAHAP